MPAHLLLVEDDREIARIVQDHLRRQGYKVTWSSTGLEGWEDFHNGSFDLVMVDLMLPEMDGFTLCKNIRLSSNVPLLIISARHEDESKVKGLELGADDYVTKPFSLSELSARISSHLRRFRRYESEEVQPRFKKYEGGLIIDEDNQLVTLHGQPIALTSKEWALLQLLAQNPQRAFSKKELYEHVWHQVNIEGNNTVSVHVKSLRTKLEEDIRDPLYIQTVWGTGYRFIGELAP
ncbi:response regulator transcription factor [Paenibacillus apiarius]|uniref:Response regulator transcription factor n=1 Tax=Paenibacillus apiarius TaxID=46240 RepID=A0ABT4DX67_9BACL|nr:response regulator transcription factor [Paenibacillus apiarius]MBN3524840.1 response regulator transcription factor [Paenibacillus apiarius]MCY9516843.1 response regulator transcription factor [Paenibacillus apiarius]MCY9521936.1 response regulator transcription factor [Paenibacillus apiarius]MCY9550482.1 response regulator transcription factor [Paenibacillus apiarius]MCY9559869.1 response regulator transcription factor [Paenibacillus apiarius]